MPPLPAPSYSTVRQRGVKKPGRRRELKTKLSKRANTRQFLERFTKLGSLASSVILAATLMGFSIVYMLTQMVQSQGIGSLSMTVDCDGNSYLPRIEGCSPSQCFRSYVPQFINSSEISQLRMLADEGMAVGGGGSGPVSIFDTASGASSSGERFVMAYNILEETGGSLNQTLLHTFQAVVDRVREYLKESLGLAVLYPASPCFFSRIIAKENAAQLNDEYWHTHVDTRQYGSFIYTALIYLNTNGEEYNGGKFEFVSSSDQDQVQQQIQPKAGSLLLFTSGEENPHRIQKVTSGIRYAVTISWTCDERARNPRRFDDLRSDSQ